jgi:tetratricopeptide (TPR) repeat protein
MAVSIIGGIIGMVLIGSLIWRYRDEKYIVFGSLAFLLGLFPVMNLIPTSGVTLVTMRWLYFPLAFFCFAVCGIKGVKPGWSKIAVILLIAVFLGAYSFYLNREHWHDEKGFFTREVLKFNNHLYAGAYAKILHQNGDDELADRYFRLGIRAFPFLVSTYIDYSAMLIDNNRFRKALSVTERGLRLAKGEESRGLLYNNKGMALSKLGMLGAAIAAFEEAVKHSPQHEGFISNLGSAYGMASKYGKSVEILKAGLVVAPNSIGIRKNLANSYMNMGEYSMAVQVLEKIPVAIRGQNPGIENLLQKARLASKE